MGDPSGNREYLEVEMVPPQLPFMVRHYPDMRYQGHRSLHFNGRCCSATGRTCQGQILAGYSRKIGENLRRTGR